MDKVYLGKTDLKISKLVYGTLTLGPLQKNMSYEDGSKCICYAYDNGIDTFDTAQFYKTYPYLKEVVKKHQDVKIISKSYAYDEKGAKNAVEECFREIGRDYVDVFLMHEQESEHTIRGHMDALEYYIKMKEKGFIGHLGLSTHRVSGVLGAMKYDQLEIIHPMINMHGMGINDGTREDMENALRQAKKMGKGIYGMKILAGGNFIKDREKAFDYAMSADFLDGYAVGMCTKQEIDYNIAYLSGNKEKARAAGAQIKDKKLFIEPWCIGCGKCIDRCEQRALSIVEGKCVVDNDKCVLCGYCSKSCPEFVIKVI